MSGRRLGSLVALIGFACSVLQAAEPALARRWVYLQINLQVSENVAKVEGILERAARAGYNGVVLADYKLNILDRVPEHYFRNAATIQRKCAELKLELIPAVAAVGYSDGILAHNPNLAEGIPAVDAPFQVVDGQAQLASTLKNPLPGGGFETHRQHAVPGWSFQDGPGEISFVDTEIKHGGEASLRWTTGGRTGGPPNARVSRVVPVTPWRQYHAAVWIKTKDFESANEVRLFALGKDGRTLSHSNLGVKREQDWTQHHVVFNSLDNSEVRLYCGTWGIGGGVLWMDDLLLEETAFVNLLRRDGCPLRVAPAEPADAPAYEEGQDFETLVDPLMGNQPWAGNFDVYHLPPKLRLTRSSRIKPGERLRVSFSHTVTIYDQQVTCCLADPEVFRVIEDQVRRVDKLFSPKTYFLSHDEIRVANWCGACRREGQSAGQLLARNVQECAAIVGKVSPSAQLCVWSDMFDPHHNAVDKFYLVNGDLSGSWEGLAPNVMIMNWNSGKPKESLPFFAKRGHSQILAGFYDHEPTAIRKWLGAGTETSAPASGVMYTTWRQDFSQLEAFAKAAWGGQP